MFDNVKLWADRSVMHGTTPQQIESLLDIGYENYNIKTNEFSMSGSLEGLKVIIKQSGVSIIGSLPKFLYGNNIMSIDRRATQEAIEKLQDCLHLELSQAKVGGFEFGQTFVMSNPVYKYLSALGEKDRLVRIPVDDKSLYYRHGGKEKLKEGYFYDKGAETKVLPPHFTNAFLLRYELRFIKRIKEQMGRNVYLETLTDKDFYRMLIEYYQTFYFDINKKVFPKVNNMSKINKCKDAQEALFGELLSKADPDVINNYIRDLKEKKSFKNPSEYTRLKKSLINIREQASPIENSDLIKELDDAIINLGAYI